MKVNFSEINAAAHNDILNLLAVMLPGGRVIKNDYVVKNPTRQDRSAGSFRINIQTGRWFDFATGDKGGDVISLYAYINSVSQIKAAQQVLTLVGHDYPNRPKDPKANQRNFLVEDIWNACIPIRGTAAEKYLEQRFLTTKVKDLRFHPKLYHSASKTTFPAMVAAIRQLGSNRIIGLHRTYLDPRTHAKAFISPNKMILGQMRGGCVQLSELAKPLVIAEGIETALSIMTVTGMPCISILSASNYNSLILPAHANEIIVAADNDEVGINAALAAAKKWSAEGRDVHFIKPDLAGQDFNDLLRGQYEEI